MWQNDINGKKIFIPSKGKSYITLLSSFDYVIPTLILNQSLKEVNSKYPLTVMIPEFQSNLKNVMDAFKIPVEIVKDFQYGKQTIKTVKNTLSKNDWSVLNTASKLRIFELKEYEKLCYLDADSLVIQNIDDIFDYPDGSMLEGDMNIGFGTCPRGITSMMVIIPRNHKSEFYLTLAKNYSCYDGDLLGYLFFYITDNSNYRIPYNYFSQKYNFENKNNVKVIHYCNKPKPWDIKILSIDDKFLEDRYILYKKKYIKYIPIFKKILNFN